MASGDILAIFLPTDAIPPTINYGTLDTRNLHFVLDFDGNIDEGAFFSGVLPNNYAGGGLTLQLWIGFSSATSGNSRWQAAIERVETGVLDIDASSFATANSVGFAAPATSGIFGIATITFTSGAQMDGLLAGEAFRLLLNRDADGTSGTDDITSDAEILRVVIKET